MIRAKGTLVGSLNVSERKVYPELENLELIPTEEKQVFSHEDTYGYDKVTLEPIPDEYIIPEGSIDITENGNIDVGNYKTAKVDVHIPPVLQDKNVTPTKETQDVIFDEGYDGLSKVTVNPIPDEYIVPNLGTKSINVNGTYNAADEGLDGYSSVEVATSGDPELEASYMSAIDNTLGRNVTKLPNGITKIGDYAFTQRTNLALSSLPETVTSIGTQAFNNCRKVSFTKLPTNVTSISAYAFQGCTNLALTSLPEGITQLYQYTFARCTNLALTSLPESLTEIGGNCFQECTNLALTSLPSKLTTIQSYTFSKCTNLALTSLPEGATSFGSYAFGDCPSLALTSLPEGVETMASNLFQNCTSLALTSLPSTLTKMSNSVFYGCSSLALTSLPESLVDIGSNAFYGCTSLTELTINGKITTVNTSTFYGCTRLTKLIIPNITSVPSLKGQNAFGGSTPIINKTGYIYVPDTLVDSFKSATNWSAFATQIKGLSEMEG